MRQIFIKLNGNNVSEKVHLKKRETEIIIHPLKREIKNLHIAILSKGGHLRRYPIQNTNITIHFASANGFECFWFEHMLEAETHTLEVNLH